MVKSLRPFLNFSISFCESSMLALVLGPGVYNEGLDEAALVSRVAKQVPVDSAVASFDLTRCLCSLDKLISIAGIDLVLNSDQHWPGFGVGLCLHLGLRPVRGRCQVQILTAP